MKKYFKIRNAAAVVLSGMMLCSVAAAQEVPQLSENSFETVVNQSGLEIANPIITDAEIEGNIVTSLDRSYAGRQLYMNINLKNSAESTVVSAVTSIYDSDGNMKKVFMASKNVDAETVLTYSIILPDNFDENFRIKTYVMDSLGGMWSYCKTFDFESDGGAGSAWTLDSDWKIQSEEKYDGMSSLKLNSVTNGAKAYQYFDANPNSTYRMSFYSKGASPFNVSALNSAGNITTEAKEIIPDNSWKEYSYLFSTSDDGRTGINFAGNGTGNTSFIDCIRITDDFMVNGGFESGDNGWMLSNAVVSAEEKSEGENSLKINASSGAFAQSSAETLSDSLYILNFKVKGTEKLKCAVKDNDKVLANLTTESTSSWKDYYLPVDTTGINNVSIEFEPTSTTGRSTYIDEVRLVNPEVQNLISNGGFEDGTTGWTFTPSSGESAAELIEEESDVYIGAKSCLVKRNQLYTAVTRSFADKIKESGDGLYYVGLWIKTTNGGTPVVLLSKQYTTNTSLNKDDRLYGIRGNDEWQFVGGTIEITNTDDLRQYRLMLYTGSGTPQVGDFYLDSICFAKIK